MELCKRTRKHEKMFTIFVSSWLSRELEDTLVVMTSGNLCEEHGCTYEWASGQNLHLTKDGKTIQCENENFVLVVVPGLSSSSSTSSSSTSPPQDSSSSLNPPGSRRNEGAPGNWRKGATGNSLQNLPEWLEDSTENLKDTEVSALADTSHDSDSERPTKVAPRKHSIYTHFPEDPNCEVCKRTQNYKGTLQKTQSRSSISGRSLVTMTTDHNVFNEGCESRNNHRCSVVVQDHAIQWIQSYPCKTKTFQETERTSRVFLEPSEKPKVTYTDNPFEFCKSCEDVSRDHRTSTLHRSETNGIAERAVRTLKEGTSAVLLQSGLGEKWWADSMECYCYLANCSRPLGRWVNTLWTAIWKNHLKARFFLLGQWLIFYFCKRPVKAPAICKECFTSNSPRMCIEYGGNLERRYFGCRHWGAGNFGLVRNPCSKAQGKRRVYFPSCTKKKRWIFFHPNRGWNSKTVC